MSRLEEIEVREKRATEGPWYWRQFGSALTLMQGDQHITTDAWLASRERTAPADREFIAGAREDVPWLLAKLRGALVVLADREAELLNLKGPCSFRDCCLHFAHRGPCDITSKDAP